MNTDSKSLQLLRVAFWVTPPRWTSGQALYFEQIDDSEEKPNVLSDGLGSRSQVCWKHAH